MLKSELKRHAALYGIFLAIIICVFGVLVAMTFASRNSWKNGLSHEIQGFLNSFSEETYTVNKFIDINSPFATSSAIFSLIKKGADSNEIYYAVILRIPTITGPAPAVFICEEKSASKKRSVSFAGFCEDFGKAADLADSRLSPSNIDYWKSIVLKIIEKSLIK